MSLVETFRAAEAEVRATEPKREVLLIDLSGIYHPAWMVNNGPLSVAFEATIGGVHRCCAKSPGALVAICLDSKKSWRKEAEPSYKAHREKLPSAFYDLLRQVKERLVNDGHLLWEAEGFEADDVIGAACEEAVKRGHDVLVATSDKDMAQLVRDGRGTLEVEVAEPQVRLLKLSTFEILGAAEVKEKFGVEPSQVGDLLALTGDTADGISGAPGVGGAKAALALRQWGNLTALGAALETDIGACGRTKPKRKDDTGEPFEWAKSINDNWDKVLLARKLVTLRTDAPINFDEIYQVREQKPLVKVEAESMDDDIPISKGLGVQVIADTSVPVTEAHLRDEDGITVGRIVGLEAPQKQAVEQTGEGLLGSLLEKPFVPKFEEALEPRSPDGAVKLAARMFNSRLFSQYPNEDAILAAMTKARAMGIPAVAALNCFHVMDGPSGKQLAPYAYLMVHLAEKDPNCEYIVPVKWSDTSATWRTKHKKFPEPIELTYTIEQATMAGLVRTTANGKPSNWIKNPEDMLVKTAGSKLARRVYSGAVMGLVAFEEMEVE